MSGCLEFSRPYIDDIIVFSATWQEHLRHFESVLGALKEAGLTANSLKWEWGGREKVHLGHIVSGGKLFVPRDRVLAMFEYVRPTSKKGIRCFLGSPSHYSKFIHNISQPTSLLTLTTSHLAPTRVVWKQAMGCVFDQLKYSFV